MLGLITFRLLVGETETPHFYDLGTFGRVPEPQNHLCYLWRPQDTQIIQEKSQTFFERYNLYKFHVVEIHNLGNIGKDGHRKSRRSV